MASMVEENTTKGESLISVIVPVYNVEKYLPRCIESILTQSYPRFELLLIDDGSTDRSLQICEEYRDQRIRLFHKENGGLSDARNYGIARMKGTYVTFIDSDDYIAPDYLRILLEMMEESNADISAVSMYEFMDDGTASGKAAATEDIRNVIPGNKSIKEMMCADKISGHACGKLFKAEMLDEHFFPKGLVFEDLYTIPYLFDQSRGSVYSTSQQYYYCLRVKSITNSISQDSIRAWEAGRDKLFEYTKGREDYRYVEGRFATSIFWDVIDRLLFSKDYISISSRLRKKYRKHLIKAWGFPILTLKGKLKVYLFLLSLEGYRRIRIRWIKQKKDSKEMIFLK